MSYFVGEATRGQHGTPRVVLTTSGCWEWTGYRNPGGYGQVKPAKSSPALLAHRWVYTESGHTIPAGYELDHLCRNRACVNPAHLEPVMSAVNTRRGLRAKLSAADVALVREAAAQWQGSLRWLARQIADDFGVTPEYLRNVMADYSYYAWQPPRPRRERTAA